MNLLADDLRHILSHTGDVWDCLRGEDIFVTGGTGFFGRWLLESFSHANRELRIGARLVVLSRDPARFRRNAPHLAADPAIQFVKGDVCHLKPEVLSSAGLPGRYRYIIHAATEASAKLNVDRPREMIDTIVGGTNAVVDFAVASETQRLLLTSSGAVYGRQAADVTHIPETYGGAPDCSDSGSAYGEGKRVAELICACASKHHGIDAIIARCFAFVGPFLPLDAHFAIGNFIRDALSQRTISIGGDGTPYRSYLYAADLAIWLWTLLLKGRPNYPYNVGSEDDQTIASIAAKVAERAGGLPVEIKRQPAKGVAPQRYVPCCRRARDELGLQAWIDLGSAIDRTLRYHRMTVDNSHTQFAL